MTLFSDEQEMATPTSLFGYKTFQEDIEKIRDEITSAGTTLGQISTHTLAGAIISAVAVTKTEHIEGKLDSAGTTLGQISVLRGDRVRDF